MAVTATDVAVGVTATITTATERTRDPSAVEADEGARRAGQLNRILDQELRRCAEAVDRLGR